MIGCDGAGVFASSGRFFKNYKLELFYHAVSSRAEIVEREKIKGSEREMVWYRGK